MNFASDNWAGAHPAIASSLTRHAEGFQPAYGTSPLDRSMEEAIKAIFETDFSVFFVATGTAANALALSAASKPGGITFCHTGSHIHEDECGAPEFISETRLRTISGKLGRMDPVRLERTIKRFSPSHVHFGQPAMVSLTQSTELGTVYSIEDIRAISGVCTNNRLPLHMDGARFANALVSLGVSPAEMTWKSGIDILSFGGTKNGCWCAEALLVFNPELAEQMAFHRKRAGQLFSKTRFIAAQFEAYLKDGLWLELAGHANAMATELASIVENAQGMRLAWQPQANEVFAVTSKTEFERLKEGGLICAPWVPPVEHAEEIDEDEVLLRLVSSFATSEKDMSDFRRLVET